MALNGHAGNKVDELGSFERHVGAADQSDRGEPTDLPPDDTTRCLDHGAVGRGEGGIRVELRRGRRSRAHGASVEREGPGTGPCPVRATATDALPRVTRWISDASASGSTNSISCPRRRVGELAAEIEELGYGAIWIPEAVGREAFTTRRCCCRAPSGSWSPPASPRSGPATPLGANSALHTVTEAFPDRFLLGLGVSHQVMVEGMRGHDYTRPYSTMKAYLDGMDAGFFTAAPPTAPARRVLAALGPKMLRLAAERTDGAHPYFVPVEHTAFAREALGPDGPRLAREQAVVLETDPTKAPEIARGHMSMYLTLPNYTNNLKRFGFDRRRPGRRRHRPPRRRHRGLG